MIRNLYNVTDEDVTALKDIEFRGWEGIKATNHDVKAVEYFIKKKLEKTSLADMLEWTHFALTSEDTNSIAYGLMLSDALGKVIIPKIEELIDRMDDFGSFGKRTKERLERQLHHLESTPVMVKLNGATGNYNAHSIAFPEVNLEGWLKFTSDFVSGFNEDRKIPLRHNPVTTQIEPHDNYAEIFDTIKRVNTILTGFSQHMEHAYSRDPETKRHFRDAQECFDTANGLNEFFSSKLPISRLQRDLSDSTVERNFGVALSYSVMGYSSILDKHLDENMRITGNVVRQESEFLRDYAISPEVVNNKGRLSYKLEEIVIPKIEELRNGIGEFADKHAATSIPGRTHGQFALPTTFGKEFHVFRARINRQLSQLKFQLNGSDGEADYADGAAEALDNLSRINTVLIDFNQDVWRYISDDWLKQKAVAGEVGSSTMPQKVNPINFENSEGNAGMSNAFLKAASTSLMLWGRAEPLVIATIDEGLSHALIAYDAALKGLSKISVNGQKVGEVLDGHWEVLAEPMQIILKKAGVKGAYELLKDFTRGKEVTLESISEFTLGLDVDRNVKWRLAQLTPQNYTGMAAQLVGVE